MRTKAHAARKIDKHVRSHSRMPLNAASNVHQIKFIYAFFTFYLVLLGHFVAKLNNIKHWPLGSALQCTKEPLFHLVLNVFAAQNSSKHAEMRVRFLTSDLFLLDHKMLQILRHSSVQLRPGRLETWQRFFSIARVFDSSDVLQNILFIYPANFVEHFFTIHFCAFFFIYFSFQQQQQKCTQIKTHIPMTGYCICNFK